MLIRNYKPSDEIGWLRCRVLSFLDTAYFDNVLQEKETYENPSIELIAEKDNQIVGLIDIEYEKNPGTVCSNVHLISGMIWHLAVHPDFQRKGIARMLLNEAIHILENKNIKRIEAWTRDDLWVNNCMRQMVLSKEIHIIMFFFEGSNELESVLSSKISNLNPVSAFAHYRGEKVEEIKKQFKRVHECNMYERIIKE